MESRGSPVNTPTTRLLKIQMTRKRVERRVTYVVAASSSVLGQASTRVETIWFLVSRVVQLSTEQYNSSFLNVVCNPPAIRDKGLSVGDEEAKKRLLQ
jgi:hypothetical protein